MSEGNRKKIPAIMHSDIPNLLGILVVLPLTAIITAMILPALSFVRSVHLIEAFWVTLIVAGIGVGLLFWARLPLYRQGKYFSFGSRALPPSSVPFYRAAYVLLIPSVLFLLLLAL